MEWPVAVSVDMRGSTRTFQQEVLPMERSGIDLDQLCNELKAIVFAPLA